MTQHKSIDPKTALFAQTMLRRICDQIGVVGVHQPVLTVPHLDPGDPVGRQATTEHTVDLSDPLGGQRHEASLQIISAEQRQHTHADGDLGRACRVVDRSIANGRSQDRAEPDADADDDQQ